MKLNIARKMSRAEIRGENEKKKVCVAQWSWIFFKSMGMKTMYQKEIQYVVIKRGMKRNSDITVTSTNECFQIKK